MCKLTGGDWRNYVVCPSCSGDLRENVASLVCQVCGISYGVFDNIPQLVPRGTPDTLLDLETYTRLAYVPPEGVAHVHNDFRHALSAAGRVLEGSLLEIGTGTGLLTEAMLRHAQFERVISTDVSLAFARHTRARLKDISVNLSFVICDGNTLPLRNGVFDVVLGRSVLHHLLHYPQTLRRAHDLLRPGGVAAFFEPVQSGKAVISFLFRLILGIEASTGAIGLTGEEKVRMARAVRGMMKTVTIDQSEETLAKLEDKYMFDVDKLCQAGRGAGFAAARYVKPFNVDPTYFSYLSMHLRSFGFRPEVAAKVAWLKAAFGDTIGAVAGENLPVPMGYFVFEKG